jgi:hypothetical protein
MLRNNVLVPQERLELSHPKVRAPKARVYTNFTTAALCYFLTLLTRKQERRVEWVNLLCVLIVEPTSNYTATEITHSTLTLQNNR